MEVGSLSGIDIPIYVIVGLQSQARIGPNQRQNNAIFDRLDVIEASCKIGSVRYPDNEYQVDFTRNDYNEVYNEIRRFYKDYIKGEGSPYISFKDSKGLYNLWVFDLRNQKNSPSSQPISVEFKFRVGFDAVAADYQATALILSQKITSVSSDGQRQSTNAKKIIEVANNIGLKDFKIYIRTDKLTTKQGIINLTDNYEKGTHWVAFYSSNYFDSFCVEVSKNIGNQLAEKGKWYVSSNSIQNINEYNCASYCLYFLYLMNKGLSFKKTIMSIINY